MTFWRTTLNLSINNTKLISEPIQIKRGIYQGDSLSPLWFCLAINPLTNLLNSTGYGFNIRLNNTTLSKLNHLLYMDDIKLYASKKNHILSLLTITENFSNDIGMSFGIDKCKTQSICRGHYENLEYITKEGEIIKNLSKGEFYKYLGINQSNHIQHSIIKENLKKQFYLRIKSILKSKLSGNNLIKAVNTYAVPLLTYSFGVIKWSKTNLQWRQSTLPIRFGGLGIRRISDICLPAFLSSINGVKKLVSLLLNSKDNELNIHHYDEALAVWGVANENEIPTIPQFQKNWNNINIKGIIANDLIFNSPRDLARFKALQCRESGDLGYMQYLLLILVLF
jgi:hypothetical protein